jgi:hypothetical protein
MPAVVYAPTVSLMGRAPLALLPRGNGDVVAVGTALRPTRPPTLWGPGERPPPPLLSPQSQEKGDRADGTRRSDDSGSSGGEGGSGRSSDDDDDGQSRRSLQADEVLGGNSRASQSQLAAERILAMLSEGEDVLPAPPPDLLLQQPTLHPLVLAEMFAPEPPKVRSLPHDAQSLVHPFTHPTLYTRKSPRCLDRTMQHMG